MRAVFLHLHPKMINESALQFHRTFGLGGMAALLILVQIITGILLRFYFVPTPAEAYDSIMFLKNRVLFGQFIRNIHYWGGAFLLVITFLHFLRVFFTGACRNRRRSNWLFGMLLLFLVVLSNFTGYLLPWDQLAYWAITVSTNMLTFVPLIGTNLRTIILGGHELDGGTLQNFFTLHTAVLPLLLVSLAMYHFWLVRKVGGILTPETTEKPVMVPVFPNLVFREAVAASVLMAILFTTSAIFNAPLLEKANPAYSMNPTKAPWYFAGVQELLMHFHPFFAAFVIPLSVVAFLAWIPFMKYDEPANGHWFISEKGKHSSKYTAVFAVTAALTGIFLNAYLVNFEMLFPGIPAFISNGVFPFFILLLLMAGFYRFCLRGLQLSKAELVQAVFVFILVGFLVLSLIGVFCRGKDMELTWPWNV